MSENEPTPSQTLLPLPATPHRRSARNATIAFFIIFILLACSVTLLRRQNAMMHFMQNAAMPVTPAPLPPSAPVSDPHMAALEDKINALTAQITTLTAKQDNGEDINASSKQSAVVIARLQSDVTALSSAVSGVQADVKRAGSSAAQNQKTTQTALATAISFIQLRETAVSGQPYATELSAMRTAARSDGDFQEQLAKLEPFAAKGAPTIAGLQTSLLTQESAANNAVDRAMAKTFWDKIMAELKTLVSVRPLHGNDNGDGFSAMENDLAHSDITASLETLKTMPIAAQTTLADWRANAEARQQIDDALRSMAEHFTALANSTTQDKP